MQRILGGEKTTRHEYTIQTKRGEDISAMIYTNPIMKEAKPSGLRELSQTYPRSNGRRRPSVNRGKACKAIQDGVFGSYGRGYCP